MRNANPLGVLFLAFSLTAGCSGGSSGSGGHSFEIVGDVAITHVGPLYEGELFSYDPVMYMQEDLDRPESLMAMPYQFFSDDRGWFYVSDYTDGNLAVFDEEGRYVRRIGAKGEGPGEFRMPMIQRVEDGMIHVWDMSVRRVTRYRVDGTFVDTFQMPNVNVFSEDPEKPRISAASIHIIDAERHLVLLNSYRNDEEGSYQAAGAMMLGAAGDTLWSFMTPEERVGYPSKFKGPDGQEYNTYANYPYGPRVGAYYAQSIGIVVIPGWGGDVQIYDLDGRLARTYRLDIPPIPLTQADRDSVTASYRANLEGDIPDSFRDQMESQLRNLQFPEQKAYFGGAIKVDDAGYLFVGTSDDYVVRGIKGVPYYVFSPRGEYLGKTRRPGGRSSEVWHGRLLISSAEAETPEDQLVVYAMRPVPEGFKFP